MVTGSGSDVPTSDDEDGDNSDSMHRTVKHIVNQRMKSMREASYYYHTYNKPGGLHSIWRHFDNKWMKPLFGGSNNKDEQLNILKMDSSMESSISDSEVDTSVGEDSEGESLLNKKGTSPTDKTSLLGGQEMVTRARTQTKLDMNSKNKKGSMDHRDQTEYNKNGSKKSSITKFKSKTPKNKRQSEDGYIPPNSSSSNN